MADDDLILTLSDGDVSDEEEEVAPEPTQGTKRKRGTEKQTPVKKPKNEDKDDDLESDFEFETTDGALLDLDSWGMNGGVAKETQPGDIEAIVARRRPAKSSDDLDDVESESVLETDDASETLSDQESEHEDGDAAENEDEVEVEIENEDGGSEDEADVAAPVSHPNDVDGASDDEADEPHDAVEQDKRNAFFAPDEEPRGAAPTSSFLSMNLHRRILKGLAEVGFNTPTPIQAKAIPVALAGKDLVGGAVTGSGKTGAFLIPIMDRLLLRPNRAPTTRVVILMPTRELALQCFEVARKLAKFTDPPITFGQAIGGLNSREQEKTLKLRPDIVIATPGRFIDLERNSPAFKVHTVEILVLDEADRMLEDGFADELNEILTKIPKSRQTMLFSATMTSKVDDLIRVGLQRPIRILVDAQKQTVAGLVQEFVRLRPGREGKRLAYLMHICTTIHTDRAIIFFRQKKDAHRVRVVFALCGLRAAELHGAMAQEQRISAIEAFRTGKAAFLLATDLASRGLDVKGIETVINYEAPQTHEIYLHRVGRTARAGRSGRACTLAAEPDRKVVKAAVRSAKAQGAQIRQRTIEASDVEAWATRLEGLEGEVEAVLREEKEEKALGQVDRDLARAENIQKFEAEIKSRPRKTWFESEKDKQVARNKGAAVLNPGGAGGEGGQGNVARKKSKLSGKEKKKLLDRDDRQEGKVSVKKSKADRLGKGEAAAGKKPQKQKQRFKGRK